MTPSPGHLQTKFQNSRHKLTPRVSKSPWSIPQYLQRELVDGIDFPEVIHHKIQKGCSRCHWPVALSGLIDFPLVFFGLNHLQWERSKTRNLVITFSIPKGWTLAEMREDKNWNKWHAWNLCAWSSLILIKIMLSAIGLVRGNGCYSSGFADNKWIKLNCLWFRQNLCLSNVTFLLPPPLSFRLNNPGLPPPGAS